MNYSDKIEDYLAGNLSKEDKDLFEQALEKNAALAEELKVQTFAQQAIKLSGEDALRKRIQHIQAETNSSNLTLVFRRNWVKVAAVAAILILAVSYFFQQNASPKMVAINAYQPEDEINLKGNSINNSLENVFELFQNGNLIEAEKYLQQLVQIDSLSGAANYYLGHVYFQSENYSKAQIHFQNTIQIIEKNPTQFSHLEENAKLNWLLSVLATENFRESENFGEILRELIQRKNPTAMEIQQKLNL